MSNFTRDPDFDPYAYPGLEPWNYTLVYCYKEGEINLLRNCIEYTFGKVCSCEPVSGKIGPECLTSSPADLVASLINIINLMYSVYQLFRAVACLTHSTGSRRSTLLRIALYSAMLTFVASMQWSILLMLTDIQTLNQTAMYLKVGAVPLVFTFSVATNCIVAIAWLQVVEQNPFTKSSFGTKNMKVFFTIFAAADTILVILANAIGIYSLAAVVQMGATFLCGAVVNILGGKLIAAMKSNSGDKTTKSNSNQRNSTASKNDPNSKPRESVSMIRMGSRKSSAKTTDVVSSSKVERVLHQITTATRQTSRRSYLIVANLLVQAILMRMKPRPGVFQLGTFTGGTITLTLSLTAGAIVNYAHILSQGSIITPASQKVMKHMSTAMPLKVTGTSTLQPTMFAGEESAA